jgi:FG-GAP repeat
VRELTAASLEGPEVAVQGFSTAGRGGATRSDRLRFTVVVLLVGVAAAAGCAAGLFTSPGGTAERATTAHHGLTSLPLAAQGPVSVALGREKPAYRVDGLEAVNPAQHLRTGFSRHGVAVASGKARLGMTLSAYGYASALEPVGSALPRASANRVSYARGALTEWYANGPLGIEQGFDVAARPAAAAGPLTLSLALSGNLAARLRNGSVLLTGRGATLRYGNLLATDARGRVLHSSLQLAEGHLLIRVADRGATYPLRIDPLIQQGKKLTGTGGIGGPGRFGYAVALSGDGNTALIGGRHDNGNTGAAWVFTRSGSTWTQQGEKLTGTGHVGEGQLGHISEGEFGESVALTADGNTALIGGPRDNGDTGAAWVFTRSGSTWSQQGKKLTGTGETGEGRFGESVALSADGATALIGGWRDNGNTGAAWVFTRSGSTWTQQGGKLTGTGEIGNAWFGFTVALSEHGDTALIGGPEDNDHTGAAWVFTRSGSTWTQQGGKLTGAGEIGEGRFGTSVALSADGNTALIGAGLDDDWIGAAWVFTRSGSTWTQQGGKLTGTGEVGEGRFGASVALSADGNTALIGGPGDDSATGAAWVFTRSGSTWSQQGEKLTGTGGTGEGMFGSDVALSADGNTALIGGPEDGSATGAAWGFTRSSGAWSQQGPKFTGGEADNTEFGVLVALSADGNTALVGGWKDNGTKGAAWVFTRSGGVWSQQGPKLTGTGEIGEGGFGTSVALSADGNTALIGAPGDNNEKGAAWVFTRSGSTWSQQGGKLTPTGEVGSPWFGYTVALSGDGKTALIGGWLDDNWKGAAWVFTRSGSTWTQQGGKLTGTGEIGEGMFGTNVALSADGNTALIGGWNDDSVLSGHLDYSGKGAAWVFTRSGGVWTQQGPKLTGAGETGEGKFGTIVALSADGNTALIGAWNDDTSKGAAWVFTRSGSTWTQQGPKLTGAGEVGEGRFGVAVALSADGDRALIGGLYDNGARGASWVFTRSGSTWTQEGGKLTGGGGSGESEFGTNVALSADGDTALIGGWRDNGGVGAAWAFVDPPTPTSGAATSVVETGATLNGTLGAGGSSKAYFQYGTTAAYGASTSKQSVGVSGNPSSLAAAIGGLAPGTIYHFRLVAENSGGVVYGGDQTFTSATPGPTSPKETPTPPVQPKPPLPPPTETSLPPVVQHVRQSAARWREGNRSARISRAKTPIGTTFSFSLNEQATVTFSFAKGVSGPKVGKITFTGHSGTNKVAFQGRISAKKRLKPGRYTLAITAANSAGMRSAPKSLSFTIVK